MKYIAGFLVIFIYCCTTKHEHPKRDRHKGVTTFDSMSSMYFYNRLWKTKFSTDEEKAAMLCHLIDYLHHYNDTFDLDNNAIDVFFKSDKFGLLKWYHINAVKEKAFPIEHHENLILYLASHFNRNPSLLWSIYEENKPVFRLLFQTCDYFKRKEIIRDIWYQKIDIDESWVRMWTKYYSDSAFMESRNVPTLKKDYFNMNPDKFTYHIMAYMLKDSVSPYDTLYLRILKGGHIRFGFFWWRTFWYRRNREGTKEVWIKILQDLGKTMQEVNAR